MVLALGAAQAACGSSAPPPARLRAQVTRHPGDTVSFEAPALASHCSRPGLGLLLQGSAGGNGVLIWLRSGDSLAAGEFSLLLRADTTAPHGATVAVRFMVGEAAHGLTLDSGAVSVTLAGASLSATARGSGLDPVAAGRVGLDASFASVPLATDTVECQVRP